jgi:hypothetical protein
MRLKVQEVGKIKRQKTFDLKVEMVSLCYKTFYRSNEICIIMVQHNTFLNCFLLMETA